MTGELRHGDGRVLNGGTADPAWDKSWTQVGHPELEGEPILATVNGPYQVPPKPPKPGPRHVTIRLHYDDWS